MLANPSLFFIIGSSLQRSNKEQVLCWADFRLVIEDPINLILYLQLMKKYNHHLAMEEARNAEAAAALAEVEAERNSFRDQLSEAMTRLESLTAAADPAPDISHRRLEVTIQDLKSRLELDSAVRKRLEVS